MTSGESAPPRLNTKSIEIMDKKMYFEPEMEVLEIKLTQMLCASGDMTDPDDNEVPSGGSTESSGGGW